MNDFEVMQKSRRKWVRECAEANRPMPSAEELAAYHRGFIDALVVALGVAIKETSAADVSSCEGEIS